MAYQSRVIRGVVLIKLKGSFIEDKAFEEVREEISHRVGSGHRHFVFDLTRVRRMNSHALGMMLACYSRVVKVEGKVGITGLSHAIETVMNITKIITLFDRFSDSREGIRAYQL